MKKYLLGVVVLVVILGLCLSSTVFAADPLLVGLVFDIGGKGDKSFNDSASRGLGWAAADFDIKRIELEPGAVLSEEMLKSDLASNPLTAINPVVLFWTILFMAIISRTESHSLIPVSQL